MLSTSSFFNAEILGSVIFILAASYIYFKYIVYQYWSKRNVFTPEPVVPFGNAWSWFIGQEGLKDVYQRYYEKYKHEHRFFGTYILYNAQLVLVDPELVKFVLAKEFTSFHDRGLYYNEKADPLSGHLFLLSGKKWRNLRVKLTPTFTSGKIKQMFGTVQEIGSELTKFLDDQVHDAAKDLEIKDIFGRFSTDVIMSTAFGVNCKSLRNPNSEFRHWGRVAFEPRRFWRTITMFIPNILKFFNISVMHKGVCDFFIGTFKENVTYRNEHNIVRRDFLDLLLQLMNKGYVAPDDDKTENGHDENKEKAGKLEKLTMLEAAAQAFVFFLAGFETSSSTATYCMYELAIHQDIQDKVRKEIDEVLEKHGGQLSYDCLNEMTYLHQVVSETLRKYPPVPILTRLCTKDTTLPGTNIRVAKGTTIVIPVIALHHDPEIYPNPENFDPERFNQENKASRHPYVWLPFGEGPRICIGMRFGFMQTKVALVSALSKFKFKLAPGMSVPLEYEKSGVVLSVKGGVHLITERR